MIDRETLLKKIDAQKKEWESQVKHLQAKAENYDADSRIEYDRQMHDLKKRLDEAERHSDKFKRAGKDDWDDLSDNIIHAWNDLVTNIDNAILRLKK